MNENSYQSFTELEVWKKARELKNEIFELVKTFPTEEKFRLSDQLIRSSRRINSSISEGHGRFTFKDQLHNRKGSLSETYNHLIDAFDCNYISKTELVQYKTKIDEIARLLNGYIAYLRRSNN